MKDPELGRFERLQVSRKRSVVLGVGSPDRCRSIFIYLKKNVYLAICFCFHCLSIIVWTHAVLNAAVFTLLYLYFLCAIEHVSHGKAL